MVTKKAPKKFTEKKDSKTEQQLLIQSAITGHYSLLTPLADCKHIYIKNPLNAQIKHFSVKDNNFAEYVKELSELGLGSKLEKDFTELISKDNNWKEVYDFLANNDSFNQNSTNQ